MPPDDPVPRVRSFVGREYGDLVDAVAEAAVSIASDRDDDPEERRAVTDPLERELDRRGLLDQFPDLIAEAAAAAELDLQTTPVAAPPYVVITGTGPVLRATVPDGRLVIGIRVFEVARNPTRYRLRTGEAADLLDVTFVQRR